MGLHNKTVQLLPFINEKKMLEESIKSEIEESLKKQVRMQFAMLKEQSRRLDKQEAIIQSLVDCVLSE
jgi:hypothetical protein